MYIRIISLLCTMPKQTIIIISQWLCNPFRTPEKYYDLKLPHKLPPPKETLPVTGLPMLGYMEQSSATAMVKALTACGNFKPKYPFLSSTRSALMYVAYHLKGKRETLLICFKGNKSLCSFKGWKKHDIDEYCELLHPTIYNKNNLYFYSSFFPYSL